MENVRIDNVFSPSSGAGNSKKRGISQMELAQFNAVMEELDIEGAAPGGGERAVDDTSG
jgi:hypothetical protein